MDPTTRFRRLFADARPALRRYAVNRGLRGADADDLVAATLEIAWRRLEDVPLDDPLPWLFAVARNVLRAHRRSEARRQAALSRLALSVRAPSREASELEPGMVRAALDSLSQGDQEILRLVAWDGLSPAQLAATLGCSAVAARTRLHRARSRLARRLGVDPRPPKAPAALCTPADSTARSHSAPRDPLEVTGG